MKDLTVRELIILYNLTKGHHNQEITKLHKKMDEELSRRGAWL